MYGYMLLQSDEAGGEIPRSRLARWAATRQGGFMPEDDREAVAEFIRTKGITRCPTACVLPTQALVVRLTERHCKHTP